MSKRRYSITLTKPFQKGLKELVKSGGYMNPQHAIRESLRDAFERHNIDPFVGTHEDVTLPKEESEG